MITGFEIVNPTARVSGEASTGSEALKRVASPKGLRIGLLDNGMPHAGDFLNHLGSSLASRYAATLLTRRKSYTARSAELALLDEIAASCDVAVTGFGVWGGCTSWSVHDTVELEKRGIPTVTVVGRGFEKAARSYGRAYKLPEIRLLLVDDTVAHQGGEQLARMATDAADQVVKEWAGEAKAATAAAPAADWSPVITVNGDFLDANGLLLDMGLTDGMPVIPPTPKLVERFVAASGRSGVEVIARLMPLMGDITVERIAANAVMAGCAPEVMPILITVVQAMGAEEYRVNHVVTTAHTLFPLIVVGGPIAKEIGMSDGRDLSAAGWRPNATIARAVRLIMYNCMSLPGYHGATCQGHLGKVADAITENLEQSPWEPIHVEMGYRVSDSVVTVMSVEPMQMVDDHSALSAQGVLANFGSQMATSGNRPMFGPAQHMLILGPAHANKVAQGGFDRKMIRRFIYEVYRIPVHQFPPESRERWSAWKKTLYGTNTVEHATIPVVEDINDIMIMVHGGAGPNSFFAPGINNHRSVTRKIG